MQYLKKFRHDLLKSCFLLMTWHLSVFNRGLKEKLEVWKGAFKAHGLIVKVKRTKMMNSSENSGKATEKSYFSRAVCRNDVNSNTNFYQFCIFATSSIPIN